MNKEYIDALVNALLYEGYSLYPYRRSIKNTKRWLFGCVYPEGHSCVRDGGESSRMTSRCLVEGSPATRLSVEVRFLHLLQRRVALLPHNWDVTCPLTDSTAFELEFVECLEVDGTRYDSRQEAEERRIALRERALSETVAEAHVAAFYLPEIREINAIQSRTGVPQGLISRRQYPLQGTIECRSHLVSDGLYTVEATIANETPPDESAEVAWDCPQLQSFVSTHTILHVEGGSFLSQIDPPEPWREIAGSLRSQGTWPVLIGEEGKRDTMLSSPIILYDYPRIAPESPGDLFDATEIDEILSLRLLALSDDEKRQLRDGDERTRQILERTEMLGEEHMQKLHGAVRSLNRLEPAGS